MANSSDPITTNATITELNQLYHNRLWNPISSLVDNNTPPSNCSLRILHHNVKSLLKKLYFYESLNLQGFCDLFSVSETWLKPSIPSSLIELEGFSVVRSDRNSTTKSRAGGTALYIRSNLPYKILSHPSIALSDVCDSSVWIEITSANQKPVIVASIYVTPDSDKSQFLQQLSLVLSSPSLIQKHIVIVGDININWNASSMEQRLLQSTLDTFGLAQHSNGVTYISHLGNESLLDHNYVSQTLNVQRCQILTCERNISDHYATFMTISYPNKSKEHRKLIFTRSLAKFEPLHFHREARKLPLLNIASNASFSINEKIELIDSEIYNLFNCQLPIRQIRVRGSKKGWLNADLLRLINLKNRYYKKMYQSSISPTDNQIRHYHKFKNYVLYQIRKTKKKYLSQKLSESSSSFYKSLRQFSGKQKSSTIIDGLSVDGRYVDVESDIAHSMNTFFTNLPNSLALNSTDTLSTHDQATTKSKLFHFRSVSCEEVLQHLNGLNPSKCGGVRQVPAFIYKSISDLLALPMSIIINQTLRNGSFPDYLKVALVTPIFKKGDKKDPSNYRPISSLPILSKVFESVIKDQLMDFLEKEHLLCSRQFGFRRHHSSEQLLQSLLTDWRASLDSKTPMFIPALSLDVRKAFDTVNHKLLISKLWQFNLSPDAIGLIQSYLSRRKQSMKVGSSISSLLPITCGVPQGSILGPILFLLMVNDFLEKFPFSFAYADDTLIFTKGSSLERSLVASEDLLRQVSSWYKNNLLQLNLSKTQFCIFSNRKIDNNYSITVSDTKIQSVGTLSVLGVQLDSELSFAPHIDSVCRKASSLVYLSSKFRKYLNVEQARLAYTSIVRPVLEYCSSLFLNTSQRNILALERVQNRAIRIILTAPVKFSVTSGRILLNLPTLISRRKYLFHKFVHKKVLNKKASHYIIKAVETSRSHNLSLRSHINIIKPYFRTNYGKSSFPSLLHTYLLKSSDSRSILCFS